MNREPVLNGSVTPDPYAAVVERNRDGHRVAEYNGLETGDFVSRALKNLEQGYGCVPLGRVDPARPDLPPHKVAWCRGLHGYDARNATPAEIRAVPAKIIRRIALGGERGLLNLGARVPTGMVGEDRDNYGRKHGLVTIAEHERRLGHRPPTYFLTARELGSGSAIYLYGVPNDWVGVGALKSHDGSPGDVETIQPHLRYLVAPGSTHHTDAMYQLYHEANGPRPLGFVLPAIDDPDLAHYPDNWAEALYRRPRRRGERPDIEDIMTVASEWVFDEHPYMLHATVRTVREATGDGETRNATHRALWIVARNARAGCYPFSRAVAEIEAAAVAAYTDRGRELDFDDFARSIEHAVGEAMDMSDAEVAAWGSWGGIKIGRQCS